MAALLLKVGTLDLADYVKAQPGDGFEPASGDHLHHQFAGSTALADGQVWVDETADNKQIAASLFLRGNGTADSAIALLSTLKAACVAGTQVQFRAEGASNISYFTLQNADVKPKYDHFRLRAGWLEVALTLYVSPRASTGTMRTVATIATTAAMGEVTIGSIVGDVPALANLHFTNGGPDTHGNPCLLGYAYHRSASFVGHWRAASMVTPVASTALTGGTTAFASQYQAVPVAPTSSAQAVTIYPPPAALPPGRYRAIVLARSRISTPSGGPIISLISPGGVSVSGGTARLAPGVEWHLLDLGECSIDDGVAVASVGPVATPGLTIGIAGASGASLIASPAFHVSALTLLPLDYAIGLPQSLTAPVDFDYSVLAYPTVANIRKKNNALVINDITPRGGPLKVFPGSASYPSGKLVTLVGDPTNFVAGPLSSLAAQVDVLERVVFMR